jgi:hypothetical protein
MTCNYESFVSNIQKVKSLGPLTVLRIGALDDGIKEFFAMDNKICYVVGRKIDNVTGKVIHILQSEYGKNTITPLMFGVADNLLNDGFEHVAIEKDYSRSASRLVKQFAGLKFCMAFGNTVDQVKTMMQSIK